MAKTVVPCVENQWPAYIFHKGVRLEVRRLRRLRPGYKRAKEAVLKAALQDALPAGNA